MTIPPLYKCQQDILSDNKKYTGIFLGTGVGKSRVALELAQGKTLVICPKQQMLDKTWQDNNEKFNLGKDITVINYDMFWRTWQSFGHYNTVILDEGHRALGVRPKTRQRKLIQVPDTSKTFEAVYSYINLVKPERFYIVTATPKGKPMNVWAAAKLFGKDWNFFKFREIFYFPIMMGRRQEWLEKTDKVTQERLAKAVQSLGYTGALSDFVDVPEQTHKVVHVPLSDEQKRALKKLSEDEADPMIRRSRIRTIENGILYSKKIEELSDK
jgi:hypothetical protein